MLTFDHVEQHLSVFEALVDVHNCGIKLLFTRLAKQRFGIPLRTFIMWKRGAIIYERPGAGKGGHVDILLQVYFKKKVIVFLSESLKHSLNQFI